MSTLLPRLAGRDHLPLHLVVRLEHLVIELIGIEILIGIEDRADADVAVHRLANDRERLGQHIGRAQLARWSDPRAAPACGRAARSSVIGWIFGFQLVDLGDDASDNA